MTQVQMQRKPCGKSGMVLLRTEMVDSEVVRLAERLDELSGFPTAYLIDERRGAVLVEDRAKVGLTRPACEALGLYCPEDFAWRCGDYGLYLARQRYPDVDVFWLIENDVRIAGQDPAALFDKFASSSADLIAGYIGAPEPDWPWHATLESRAVVPQKCFFPVVRLSARAIDILLQKRRAHGRSWARRKLWPNDEAFVATTLVAEGALTLDLNAGAPPVYRTNEFSFDTIRDGSLPLPEDVRVALLHPVLSGEPLRRKQARVAHRVRARGELDRLRSRFRRVMNHTAFARLLNRRSPW